MAELRLKMIDEADIDTVFADDVEFEGELAFQEPVLVKGVLKGKLESSADVYISEQATVEAEVAAEVVSVKGRLNGDIFARRKLELFSSGRVGGTLRTPDLIVQSGALFNGTCRMDGNLNSPALPGE
ncbi:MAG: polymer-forming cytoskeletal protein [Spirochaetaceae bacterium]|nr:MAG: polymer-forming cytoskeletal protein [Spirochaetaceae bacterium]